MVISGDDVVTAATGVVTAGPRWSHGGVIVAYRPCVPSVRTCFTVSAPQQPEIPGRDVGRQTK